MSFERCAPDSVMLARLVAELDVPMDEHECMIEAVDSVSYEWFMKEIESYSRVREGWERFLLASHNNETNDF